MISDFSLSLHPLEEIVKVFSNSFDVRVLGSQHACADGQGALEKRLGLLILPLVGVEIGQVFDTGDGVQVIGP